jgi:hypothetical protein
MYFTHLTAIQISPHSDWTGNPIHTPNLTVLTHNNTSLPSEANVPLRGHQILDERVDDARPLLVLT